MKRIGWIPRRRLENIPENLRSAHEFCFFVHDECARAIVEYENAEAHAETIHFRNESDRSRFEKIVDKLDAIGALRELGYHRDVEKVIANNITMAMISDCLHHLYESLICFEKRKYVVGFNVLRKPLKDSLLYLAWMYGSWDDFYDVFTRGDARYLSQSVIGCRRMEILSRAVGELDYGFFFDSAAIESMVYDRKYADGLEVLFQHAVHLVTAKYLELKTSGENFNFIFKNPFDDDVYELLYKNLPYLLLFLCHIIIGLFDRMKEMDRASKMFLHMRTLYLFCLISMPHKNHVLTSIQDILSEPLRCLSCRHESRITEYNAARMLMMSDFRCNRCQKINPFLSFSYPETSL